MCNTVMHLQIHAYTVFTVYIYVLFKSVVAKKSCSVVVYEMYCVFVAPQCNDDADDDNEDDTARTSYVCNFYLGQYPSLCRLNNFFISLLFLRRHFTNSLHWTTGDVTSRSMNYLKYFLIKQNQNFSFWRIHTYLCTYILS